MSTAAPLPAPVSQAATFRHLQARLLSNTLRVLLQQGSLRVVMILVCSLVVWVGVFAASYEGFRFIASNGLSLTGGLVGLLFDLLFLALALMLVFSTGLILYSSLFSSAETAFLLSTPARADQVFAYKFKAAIGFSSWAFLLLGTPILLAFGVVYGAGWLYYLTLPGFFVGYLLLPGSVGAIFCLLIVNYFPKHRKQMFALCVLVLMGIAGFWGYRILSSSHGPIMSRDEVQSLIGNFSLAQSALMPTHWMGRGLQSAARGSLADTGYDLALIWSHGLVAYTLAACLSVFAYRRGFNRLATGGTLRRRYGSNWMDRTLSLTLGFLQPQTRLLIVKDFRTFRRDPAQWAQILIFTGLLCFYFLNIRRLYLGDIDWNYRNGVSLLNLGATGLLLCTYTSRFIYPMLSLEGRKFWILGLLPLKRERLLWGKFAFSATGAVVIAEFLVLLSDLMLGLPILAMVLHALCVGCLAMGLSGLSVGLGACMPNFRETDPSKIAVGFGGTLNLVAGLFYLLVVIALVGLPWHLYAALQARPDGNPPVPPLDPILLASALAGVAVSAAAVIVPLKAGATALQRMEF